MRNFCPVLLKLCPLFLCVPGTLPNLLCFHIFASHRPCISRLNLHPKGKELSDSKSRLNICIVDYSKLFVTFIAPITTTTNLKPTRTTVKPYFVLRLFYSWTKCFKTLILKLRFISWSIIRDRYTSLYTRTLIKPEPVLNRWSKADNVPGHSTWKNSRF